MLPVVAASRVALGDVIVAACFAALVLFVNFHGYIPRGLLVLSLSLSLSYNKIFFAQTVSRLSPLFSLPSYPGIPAIHSMSLRNGQRMKVHSDTRTS